MKRAAFLILACLLLLALTAGCGKGAAPLTAEDYLALGDDERADETLRRRERRPDGGGMPMDGESAEEAAGGREDQTPDGGEDRSPDSGSDSNPQAGAMPFEIITIYDTALYAPNGEEIGHVASRRPVFDSGYRYADRFNECFGEFLAPLTEQEVQEHYRVIMDEAVRFAQDQEAMGNAYAYSLGYGGFYFDDACQVAYYDGTYVSFVVSSGGFYTGAAHGWYYANGYTFNLATGDILSLSDVLAVDADTVGEKLANEFIVQYADDSPSGDWHYWDSTFRRTDYDQLVAASTLDIQFSLGDDGIHIYYEQYTFYYAYGARELVIPYARFDLVRPPFAVQPKNWQDAYSVILRSKEAGIRNFEKVEWLDFSPKIAVADICGDRTPELLFVAREYRDSVYFYNLYVWGYDNGAICLLDSKYMGAEVGGGGNFGVAGLRGGRLLTYDSNGDEGWWGTYEVFELLDGSLTSTLALDFSSLPQYQYDNYWEMPFIDTYYKNGAEISEREYRNEESSLFSAIETPLLTPYFGEGEFYDRFSGDIAMTFDEAVAYLNR